MNGLFYRQAEWMKDIYYPPWCRAGPYFVGVLLGFVLFRVNGRVKMHPVSTSLHYVVVLRKPHRALCSICCVHFLRSRTDSHMKFEYVVLMFFENVMVQNNIILLAKSIRSQDHIMWHNWWTSGIVIFKLSRNIASEKHCARKTFKRKKSVVKVAIFCACP